MDFWGYSDFPYPDAINYYERNVDPETGRPRIAGATGSCRTPGVFLFPSAGAGGTPGVPLNFATFRYDNPAIPQPMQGGLGMGVDPDCLKAGSAAGGVAENRWNATDGDYEALLAWYADPTTNPLPVLYDGLGQSPQNALENHSANLQIFAFICSGTVSIGASVDPGACAWSIFTSGKPLSAAAPLLPLTEVFSTLFAGEHGAAAQDFFNTLTTQTKGRQTQYTPARNLNDDFNDGFITALNPNFINPAGTANDLLTMDQVLSNEQRALLGCGPFFGTRCDSGRGGIAMDPFGDRSTTRDRAGHSAAGWTFSTPRRA